MSNPYVDEFSNPLPGHAGEAEGWRSACAWVIDMLRTDENLHAVAREVYEKGGAFNTTVPMLWAVAAFLENLDTTE